MLLKNWKIRKAELTDINYFHQAIEQVYMYSINMEIFMQQFKKKIKNKNSLLYVAVNTLGNQMGCIICEKEENIISNKPNFQIKEFYISPNYRKLNVADDLFLHVYEKAMKQGVEKIEVLCNLTSTTTQNFYSRKKFKPIKKLYVKSL
jgi:N-acetylglutamate synthase-like GNAT family acetyltransferase